MWKNGKCDVTWSLHPLPLSQTVTLSQTPSPLWSVTYFMDGPWVWWWKVRKTNQFSQRMSQLSDLRWGVYNVMEFWSFFDSKSSRVKNELKSIAVVDYWFWDKESCSSLYSLEWMREVAIVQAVLWSKVLRIRCRSRIWEKQDFEMCDIWIQICLDHY